jgi:hypothetical protein
METASVTPNLPPVDLAGGMRLTLWCRQVGVSSRTALRWRNEGKLPGVVTRNGVLFITAAAIRNFFTNDGSSPARGMAARKAALRAQRAAA